LYLTGTCSGGNEALKLATKYPGIFAALGLVSPEVVFPKESRESPMHFIKNLNQTPVYVTHSAIDRHVAVERSRYLVGYAQAVGLEGFVYEELPREFPMYYSDDFFDEAIGFCTKHTLDNSPEEINFSTNQMLYNRSGWVTLNQIKDTARFYATMKWPNTLKIEKSNVLNYSIDLKTLPCNPHKKLKVVDNGAVVFDGLPLGKELTFGDNPDGLMKTNTIAGPFSHLFSYRFVVVVGTGCPPSEQRQLDSIAQKISDLWFDRYLVRCMVKKDVEITVDDVEQSNLLLLGNYSSNTQMAKLQEQLPLQLSDSGVRFQNKELLGKNLGFYLIYPNPANSFRYVAVIGSNNSSRVSLGSEREVLDDISNYGWFDYKVWDNTNGRVLVSGYFDAFWR
jgi:hypothetical protein